MYTLGTRALQIPGGSCDGSRWFLNETHEALYLPHFGSVPSMVQDGSGWFACTQQVLKFDFRESSKNACILNVVFRRHQLRRPLYSGRRNPLTPVFLAQNVSLWNNSGISFVVDAIHENCRQYD